MESKCLLEIATGVARTVGDAIRSLANQRDLGKEIGTIGASGDKTKQADQQAVGAAKNFLLNSPKWGGVFNR